MQLLGYPDSSSSWIKPYYFTMPELDKELIAKVFMTPGDENLECTILVTTDTYGMGIDNPDIVLVIQWDILLSFDSMIQRLGRAGRKGGQSTFILFTPKWIQVQSLDEIQKRSSTTKSSTSSGLESQLSDSNRPKHNSPLALIASTEDQISDTESIAGSIADSDFDNNECSMNDSELLSTFMATEAKIEAIKQSSK